MNQSALERQIQLEEEALGLGVIRYRERRHGTSTKAPTPESELPPGLRLLRQAINPMAEAVIEFLEEHGFGHGGKRPRGRPPVSLSALSNVEPTVAAFITAKICIDHCAKNDTLANVATYVANTLNEEMQMERFASEHQRLFRYLMDHVSQSNNARYRRTVMKLAARRNGVEEAWNTKDKLLIGTKLVEMFIKTTGLVELNRYTVRENGKPKSYIRVVASQKLLDYLEKQHARCELLGPLYMPMVIKPMQWLGPYTGGYINRQMRFGGLVKTDHRPYLEELKGYPMPLVYRAVNAIQETPWQISRPIYDVLRVVWENGGSLGKLPERHDEPVPAKPWKKDETPDSDTLKRWKARASSVHSRNARVRSKRISIQQKLWLAEKFLDEPEIYFPHTLDWRGRAYPTVSGVNMQNDDVGRALIRFATGKPLGQAGAFWLAVHGANLYGEDKISLEDRVKWVYENQEMIWDSAVDPIDGQRGWTKADKPWQFLAFCFEWAGYLAQGPGFVSYLPVHVDGSSNGLQNYSAMLRDPVGGAAVNLVPSSTPQDIYQLVADRVMKVLEQDESELARAWLAYGIDRQLVKRNVMTVPYNSKQYGMGGQLYLEMRKRLDEGDKHWPREMPIGRACHYLARIVYAEINQVVTSARVAMDWLVQVARVAAGNDLPLRWTTPAGLPVQQAYYGTAGGRVHTFINGTRTRLNYIQQTNRLDRRKQAQGVAPNFVHSLDAAHMMLTVNLMAQAGEYSFSMVHDSYGTHASDMELMMQKLREAFVEMYSTNILEDFRQEILTQLPANLQAQIPPVPEMGDLDLSQVLESDFFFS